MLVAQAKDAAVTKQDTTSQLWTRVQILARGGTASITLVRHAATGQWAVSKELLPHLAAQPEMAERLRDEALLLARLRHAGVAQVLGLHEDRGAVAVTLEFLHGQTLHAIRNRLARVGGAWPDGAREALYLALARTLAVVHGAPDLEGNAASLVHRDVSPENILITYDGRVVLLDFGVATSRPARRADLCGKPQYMAPEQARRLTIDGRADLFSLGLMMWEDFAGQRPWGERPANATLDLLQQGRPLPFTRCPLSGELGALIDQLAQREANRRPPSAAHVVARLTALAPGAGDSAPLVRLLEALFAGERRVFERRLTGAPTAPPPTPVAPPRETPEAQRAPAATEPSPAVADVLTAALARLRAVSGSRSAGVFAEALALNRAGTSEEAGRAALQLGALGLALRSVLAGRAQTLRLVASREVLHARLDADRVVLATTDVGADDRLIRVALNSSFLLLPATAEARPGSSSPISSTPPAACGVTLVATDEEEDSMHQAQTLLQQLPAFRALVVSRRDGSVISNAGDADPDIIGAVSSLSVRNLEEIADLLALGDVEGWVLSSEVGAIATAVQGPNLVTAMGSSARNLDAALKSVQAVSRSTP